MIAVADASPLCYLVLIREVDLLPQFFGREMFPQAVVLELLHESAPEAVRRWASRLQGWIEAEVTLDVILPGMKKLQAGERAAMFRAMVEQVAHGQRKLLSGMPTTTNSHDGGTPQVQERTAVGTRAG